MAYGSDAQSRKGVAIARLAAGGIMGPNAGPSVVVATKTACGLTPRRYWLLVRTPLDLIRALDANPSLSTAILADAFALEEAFTVFLRDQYPHLRLITVPEQVAA